MSEHYPVNTKAVMSWCNVCRKNTMHRVDDRRLGSCLVRHVPDGLSAAQKKRREQQDLAAQQPALEGF